MKTKYMAYQMDSKGRTHRLEMTFDLFPDDVKVYTYKAPLVGFPEKVVFWHVYLDKSRYGVAPMNDDDEKEINFQLQFH